MTGARAAGAKAQEISISCDTNHYRLHFKSVIEQLAVTTFFKLRAFTNYMYIATYTYECPFNFIKVVVGDRVSQ